jgi:hypothetical protein
MSVNVAADICRRYLLILDDMTLYIRDENMRDTAGRAHISLQGIIFSKYIHHPHAVPITRVLLATTL